MLKRKLPRATSRYVTDDERQPPDDAPTFLRCTIWDQGDTMSWPVILVRQRVDDREGGRVIVCTPFPTVQLCTGDVAFVPPWLKQLTVELTWSTYIRLMKRRKDLPVDQHYALLDVRAEYYTTTFVGVLR